MANQFETVIRNRSNNLDSILATNTVIRNTYILLSMTLLFSAACAWFALATNAQFMNPIVNIALLFGLLFLVQSLRNSGAGIIAVFAFTGFMGYTLGPVLNVYMHMYSNGSELIMTAFTGTAVIFLGLSAYAINSRKDFSFLGGFLLTGMLVVFVALIDTLFVQMPVMENVISAVLVMIMSGYILFDTSRIINGGETNYISATISLYLDIYNLFVNLLRLLAIFGGRRD